MKPLTPSASVASSGIYTDLHSLQNIKREGDRDLAIKQVAQEFEALMLNMMFKSMRSANSAFEKDSLFNSGDTQFYRDMYDQQLSVTLAKGKGIGLADLIYRQLSGPAGASAAPQGASQNNTEIPSAMAFDDKRRVTGSPYNRNADNGATGASAPEPTPSPSVFESAKDFVHSVLPAVRKAASVLGVNPLLLVSQAALETGWGKHIIRDNSGQSSHNLFNIKADASWQGERVAVDTLEYSEGAAYQERAWFRSYENLQQSIEDFVEFLQANPRYESALAQASSEEGFAQGLQAAGYATDPQYSEKVLAVFQRLQREYTGASDETTSGDRF